MTNDPYLNAKYLTDEMLREQWVLDFKFSEMVIQSWPFLFENLNDFLFQFSTDEHTNSNDDSISYNEGFFSKIDNIIYVENTETNQLYIVTNISYETLLLTAIEYYINSYKSFSVGNYQFMTFKLLEFLNNMKNPDELLTRIQNSDFLENINRDNLILGCINFFVLMRSKSFDPNSLIVKKFLIY